MPARINAPIGAIGEITASLDSDLFGIVGLPTHLDA